VTWFRWSFDKGWNLVAQPSLLKDRSRFVRFNPIRQLRAAHFDGAANEVPAFVRPAKIARKDQPSQGKLEGLVNGNDRMGPYPRTTLAA
jgi:hypothetical protein